MRSIHYLAAEAVAKYEAMSPVDRALHDAEQRRSYVRGEAGRDPGADVLAEEVKRLHPRAEALEGVLRQAMDSRAPDLADAEHPGWSDRARAALGDTP